MIIKLIQDYIKPYFGARKVTLNDYLEDLCLDSMAKTDIIEQVERAFNIKNLNATSMVKCKTVGDFVKAVDKAMTQQKKKKHSTLLCEYRNNVPYCKLTGYKCRKLANKQIASGEDMCNLIKCETAKNFYKLAALAQQQNKIK